MSVTLPDNLVREAASVGLTPQAIASLVHDEIIRRSEIVSANEAERASLAEFYHKLNALSALSFAELVGKINEAYSEPLDEEEQELVRHIGEHQRYLLELEGDEW